MTLALIEYLIEIQTQFMCNPLTGMKNHQYLSSWAKYEKSKGTLLSSTFKVGEGKVPLFF